MVEFKKIAEMTVYKGETANYILKGIINQGFAIAVSEDYSGYTEYIILEKLDSNGRKAFYGDSKFYHGF